MTIFTLQASAIEMPYWYLADIDLGIVCDKLIVGSIFCKHRIIAFIKVSWEIVSNKVSFSESSLNKTKSYSYDYNNIQIVFYNNNSM